HAAAKSDRIFQVGHNRRFAPVYKALKNFIAGGRLTPLSVHAKMNRGDLAEPPWIWDAAITGGFLYETPVHMLDLMRFFFGEVEWVEAVARAHEHGELDDFSILLGFKCGIHATLKTFGHASWHFPFERIEVFGMHSTYETFEMERMAVTQELNGETMTSDYSALPRGEKWGYVGEDAHFIDALEGKSACAVTAEDGFRSVELIEACYQSARVGQRIFLPL
ncbi:MAG: Gfo/Idh/MocA family protein, partial [Terriglobia bacterium]